MQKIFKIYYSKQIQKKHKVYNDGYLLFENKQLKLIDEEGKKLYNDSRINTILKTVEEEIEDCGDGFRLGNYFSKLLI